MRRGEVSNKAPKVDGIHTKSYCVLCTVKLFACISMCLFVRKVTIRRRGGQLIAVILRENVWQKESDYWLNLGWCWRPQRTAFGCHNTCQREYPTEIPDCELTLNWVSVPTVWVKLNHLTPNGHFSGRTAPLTSRCCIFLFIQQIYVLNILNMLHTLCFFLFKMPFIS